MSRSRLFRKATVFGALTLVVGCAGAQLHGPRDLQLDVCETLSEAPAERLQCMEDWLLDHPRSLSSTQIRYALANGWIAAGNPGRALELAEDILRSEPNNTLAKALLARSASIANPELDSATGGNAAKSKPTDTKPVPKKIEEPVMRLMVSRSQKVKVRILRGPVTVVSEGRVRRIVRGTLTLTPPGRIECDQDCMWTHKGDVFRHNMTWSDTSKLWYAELPIETYLQGVVGSEMATGWPEEALKAQAVVSRTYAWAFYAGRDDPVVLEPTTWHQVYKGGAPASDVVRAVKQTRGRILEYKGNPIVSYFHADNGGYSEHPSFVWGGKMKYFTMVTDPYSDVVPRWEWTIGKADFLKKLERSLLPPGRKLNKVRLQQHHGRRIYKVMLETDKGDVAVSGNDFRLQMGPRRLKSLWFRLYSEGNNYRFAGRGYGHGVGLSQWGARRRAEQGQKYPEILKPYYVGTELVQRW